MRKFIQQLGFFLASSVLLVALSSRVPAKSTDWNAAADGNFSTASNWDNGVPGANDDAFFEFSSSTPYTVSFNGGSLFLPPPVYQVSNTTVRSNVTFAQAGAGRTPTFATSGQLTVEDKPATTKIPISAAYAVIDGGGLLVDGATLTVTANDPPGGSVLKVGVGLFKALLTINNGGQVELTATGASAAIATGSGIVFASEVDVDGSSSKLVLDGSGPLKIGDSGSGTLKITSGGKVDDNIGLIGSGGSAAGYGQVTVDGAASLWANRDHVNIGIPTSDTQSSLTLANGGTVTVTNQLLVTTHGLIFGSGSITAGSLMNQALIAPGSDVSNLHFPGVLHLTTSFSQTSTGSLQVQLAGTTAGTQYDQVLISGTSLLSGNLNVALADNFVPAAGNSFHILDLGTRTGVFTTINLPTLASGLTWDTSQLYSAGIIAVVGLTIAGDYNDNGVVDAADYVVWRKGFGTTYTQNDYDIWRAHFGQTSGGSYGSGAGVNTAVPEPATSLLLLFATAGWWLRRRRDA